MTTLPIRLLPSPVPVTFDEIIAGIDRFNREGRNPFGPNVPVTSHSPLRFLLEGPGIGIEFEYLPLTERRKRLPSCKSSPVLRRGMRSSTR